MLGEFLANNAPDVTVQIVVKSKEDWDEYIDSVSFILYLIELSFHFIYLFQVCRSYGFYERHCPFVYTLQGDLIGDGSDFLEHVRNNYCRASITPTTEQAENRKRANMKQIEELMRRRVGLTLEEKISEHQKKIVTKNVISHINDCFYDPYEEHGQIYYLRRTDL